MESNIGPIGPDTKRGWTVSVDGEVVEASLVQIEHPTFGLLSYGQLPGAAFDTWSFHEAGGGGSVIIPWVEIDEVLYVGVVEQMRPNQNRDKPVLNVPRGFLQPGATHFQTAEAETADELGLVDGKIGKPVELSGDPGNPNSTFFETWGVVIENETEKPEGIRFYGLPFSARLLDADGNGFRLRPGVLKTDTATKTAKLAEQILGARFIPIAEASRLGDMMTLAAITRLHASR